MIIAHRLRTRTSRKAAIEVSSCPSLCTQRVAVEVAGEAPRADKVTKLRSVRAARDGKQNTSVDTLPRLGSVDRSRSRVDNNCMAVHVHVASPSTQCLRVLNEAVRQEATKEPSRVSRGQESPPPRLFELNAKPPPFSPPHPPPFSVRPNPFLCARNPSSKRAPRSLR